MFKYIIILIVIASGLFLALRDKDPVVSNAEILINAPIQKVWNIQTDLAHWGEWNKEIESIEVRGELGVGTVFVWKSGGITIESTITEYQPNTTIAWRGEAIGVHAYHAWRFTENGNTTQIYTEEKFTGLLPWLLPGTMRKQLDSALEQGVQALKIAAEEKILAKDTSTQ